MPGLKELSKRKELLSPGHRMCPGCASPVIVRQVLLSTETNVVVGSATSCLEVSTSVFPYTSWRCSWIHNAFENVAATISGVETAYRALKKKGKIDADFRFIALGGDGGTYDIGLQALSGALERGHSVHAVRDAIASIYPEQHAAGMERLRASGVDLPMTQSVLFEWLGAAGTPEFRELLPLLK